MRLAIELLFSLLRSNKGGSVNITYDPSQDRGVWFVTLHLGETVKTPFGTYKASVFVGQDDLPYRAAVKAYNASGERNGE